MDLILRNARLVGERERRDRHRHRQGSHRRHRAEARGRGRELDLGGRLVDAGVHRDAHPSRQVVHPGPLQGRERGDLEEAIGEVARQKKLFTAEDVYAARQAARLEKAILNGTTHMRTQLEVDPGIGLRGLEGVRPLIEEYKLGDRSRDLHLSAGGPAQQPRHRGADAARR